MNGKLNRASELFSRSNLAWKINEQHELAVDCENKKSSIIIELEKGELF